MVDIEESWLLSKSKLASFMVDADCGPMGSRSTAAGVESSGGGSQRGRKLARFEAWSRRQPGPK